MPALPVQDPPFHDPFGPIRDREYPDRDDCIYLNAASWGLLPASAARAVADLVLRRNRGSGFDETEWPRALWRARNGAAALLGVPVERIALAPNTSYGVNLAAHLAGQGPRGTVVLSDGEFPANVYPWLELQRHGFTVDRIPTRPDGTPDEERILERARGEDVRAVAVSAVQFHSGYRMDLAALGTVCRDREVLFAVDGIQALGLDPLYPESVGIDVLSTGGQKWLCSPWGTGFVYLSERILRDARPQVFSWLAYEGTQQLGGVLSYDMGYLADARRFELHTLGVHDFLGHGIALEMFSELGPARVRRYVLDLQKPVLAALAKAEGVTLGAPGGEETRGGILAFRVEGEGRQERVAAALESVGAVFVVREGYVRLAPHVYNTFPEMERVAEAIRGELV